MAAQSKRESVSLTEYAAWAGVSYQLALNRVLRKEVRGWQEGGRWRVAAEELKHDRPGSDRAPRESATV